jgi:hypothetical protein
MVQRVGIAPTSRERLLNKEAGCADFQQALCNRRGARVQRPFDGRRGHGGGQLKDRDCCGQRICDGVRGDRQLHALAKFRVDRLLAGRVVAALWLPFRLILSRLGTLSVRALGFRVVTCIVPGMRHLDGG